MLILIWNNSDVPINHNTQRKKAIMHQVSTMLDASKNVLFPGHNHLLTIGTDDPSLIITWAGARVIIQHSYSI